MNSSTNAVLRRWLGTALALLALLVPFVPSAPRADQVRVVATIPDIADIAKEIGGDRVKVSTMCRGRENLHKVTPRPSHLIALSKADLFCELGLWAETTWLPSLLRKARNNKIMPGAPGFVDCAEGWDALDVPATLSREGGDLHPGGNPHYNLDPRGGRQIAGRILAGLVRVDPAGREVYEKGHAQLVERMRAAEERWAKIAAEWKGKRVVQYHTEFRYLCQHYGIELAGTVEPKPGIPPTASHLASLIRDLRAQPADVILTSSWSNNRNAQEVSHESGVPLIELPAMVGGARDTDTWIGMMDFVHDRLDEVFSDGSKDG